MPFCPPPPYLFMPIADGCSIPRPQSPTNPSTKVPPEPESGEGELKMLG